MNDSVFERFCVQAQYEQIYIFNPVGKGVLLQFDTWFYSGQIGIDYWTIGKLRDESNQEIDMEVADADLLAEDINEGDWVYFDKDNKIFKEEQRIAGILQ